MVDPTFKLVRLNSKGLFFDIAVLNLADYLPIFVMLQTQALDSTNVTISLTC